MQSLQVALFLTAAAAALKKLKKLKKEDADADGDEGPWCRFVVLRCIPLQIGATRFWNCL